MNISSSYECFMENNPSMLDEFKLFTFKYQVHEFCCLHNIVDRTVFTHSNPDTTVARTHI